ncbi:hypothetical protein JS510_02945 [Mycoplasma tauri]|uniref:hypothetical protein n=1 Tax=Mycoplasma tauri TaxID=547987 RepID=UPI00196780EC|nr:hypothetical protein [Mycoplasma tauri]QSB07441.1 hypothetical protein JS510_02945 [Mycoplasma tauri]
MNFLTKNNRSFKKLTGVLITLFVFSIILIIASFMRPNDINENNVNAQLFGNGFLTGFYILDVKKILSLTLSGVYEFINKSESPSMIAGFYLGTILIILFSLQALYAGFLIVLSVLRSIFSKSLVGIILTAILVAAFFIAIIIIATIGKSYYDFNKVKAMSIAGSVFLIISSVLSYAANNFVNEKNKENKK